MIRVMMRMMRRSLPQLRRSIPRGKLAAAARPSFAWTPRVRESKLSPSHSQTDSASASWHHAARTRGHGGVTAPSQQQAQAHLQRISIIFSSISILNIIASSTSSAPPASSKAPKLPA
eukprot:1817873-Rhodomonas_salina.3